MQVFDHDHEGTFDRRPLEKRAHALQDQPCQRVTLEGWLTAAIGPDKLKPIMVARNEKTLVAVSCVIADTKRWSLCGASSLAS